MLRIGAGTSCKMSRNRTESRARNCGHRDADEIGGAGRNRRRIYRHRQLNHQRRQRIFARVEERRLRDQIDRSAGVGELDRIVDASFGRPGKRTVRDEGAGVIRIEDELRDLVLRGPDLSCIKDLRHVLRSVEVDLQLWRIAPSLPNSRWDAYFLPPAAVGSGVRLWIDANRLNVEQNILKVGRRNPQEADFDRRGLSACQGRAKASKYYRKCNRESQGQIANSPTH